MKKKLISQLVCVTIALSLTSVSALAEETNAAAEVNEGAAAGDLGSSAARKFDCEAWVPTQGRYRELTSMP